LGIINVGFDVRAKLLIRLFAITDTADKIRVKWESTSDVYRLQASLIRGIKLG
jgi:hypothetical protein